MSGSRSQSRSQRDFRREDEDAHTDVEHSSDAETLCGDEPPPRAEREPRGQNNLPPGWLATRKPRLLKIVIYLLQAIGGVFVFLAWASDGEHWSYINVRGFSIGGRGYCDG